MNSVVKYDIIRIGFLSNISSELVIEFSISLTSPLILAMMSPFLSDEKKFSGRYIIFEYTNVLMSRTTPVLNGIITADDPK